MIPSLSEILGRFGIGAAFVPLALAAVLTAVVLVAPTITRWFEDRDS
jgi:hypothetical protein